MYPLIVYARLREKNIYRKRVWNVLYLMRLCSFTLRKVWRYQRGNQSTYIEEQTTQWPKEKLLVVNTSRSFPRSWLITGFVTRLPRWVPLVEQELITLPEHLSSPPVFSGDRATWSLVLYVYFCRLLFVLLLIFFWPLCCLFFFDIRILINTLVYSNSSYKRTNNDLQNICIKLNIK